MSFIRYDAQGRVTEKATYPASYQSATTAPPLDAASGVTQTQWHPTWNLPLKTAEAYLITSYSYDSKGNLLERIETPTPDATGAQGFNAAPSGEAQTTRWTYDARNLPTGIVELEGGTETGRWEMVYNATGDLTGITHVTTGTVATLNPVGNGASQVTDIRLFIGSNALGFKRSRLALVLFVSKANASPALILLPAFSEAAVGKFVAWCAGMSGAGLGIVLANAAKDASCISDPDKCKARGKWTCTASCNVQQINPNALCPERVTGTAGGSNEPAACLEAKRAATQSTPRGCYPRHCQCRDCFKR